MTSRPNSLDQFCVNFANERLHSFVQKRIFEAQVDEYQTEGISHFVPTVPYFDNAECIRLLQNKPGGLIYIMDDQAHRSHKKTDHTMVEAFASPVAYTVEGFLDRNLDALNPDFVSLLRGSSTNVSDGAEGAGSINPFVKDLWLCHLVIAILGMVTCPTQHFGARIALIAATHQRVVSVVPTKSVLQYGGTAADNLFPVQVSALCNGISGTVSPWVQLNSANNTDVNAQYHDFRAITNDSRSDWYFESMTLMRWNNHVGYVGYTPQEITNMANTGYSLGIYNSMIYDLTAYVNSGPSVVAPYGSRSTRQSELLKLVLVLVVQAAYIFFSFSTSNQIFVRARRTH
ncbi:P-loop containing nucleoside triphosphate hydrolase protein [Melanogaster broomeanus]|nr:P-loop containing nucleoside triphosphate hydrolase protein [Melanogaster broomeanus]